MSPETAEIAIKALVKQIRRRLEEAARMARAGQACAEAGSPEKGIEVVLEMGQSLYEAKKLLEGTLGVSRCSKA